MLNLVTLCTTTIISRTRDPFPIPDRGIIGRVPAVFVFIPFSQTPKTKIPTRIVQRRQNTILYTTINGTRYTTIIIFRIRDPIPIPARYCILTYCDGAFII